MDSATDVRRAINELLGSEFVQSFEPAAQAIATPGRIPDVVAEHRMLELLARLAHSGLIFDPETPSDLQRKVRFMIGAAPEKNWISKDLAQSLASSEATFRRRLADQG